MDFLMVIMACGIARGHVRTMTMMVTESRYMAAILQIPNRLTDLQPWFIVYFNTGHPCYD